MNIDKEWDPVSVRMGHAKCRFNLSEIRLHPERFQSFDQNRRDAYRSDLSDVMTFDHDSAGVVSVWRDPSDHALYMVDGHQRYDLATRSGTQYLSGQVLDYESSSEAFLAGAIINIAQWVRYPTRRLWAICSRLERIQEVLDRGDILEDSRIWGKLLNSIPELAESVYAHCPSARMNRQSG